ncbi:hypothetical protein [Nonomuraea ferruginea]
MVTVLVAGSAVLAGGGGVAVADVPVRTGWLPNCGGDYFKPCEGEPYRLLMRDGRWVKLPDAARYATKADGSRAGEAEDGPSPLEVSGDGRAIAYFRAGDGRLVVRRGPGGKPVVLPAYGEGAGTAHVRLLLSADGRRLLVDFSDAAKRRDGVVVDTSSGRTLRGVPAGDRALGFSADGDEVLATRDRPDRTVQVVVHRLRGGSHAVTPPQEVVIHHTALALAADGRTLLALLPQGLTSEKAPQQVRRYDLRRGAWLGPGRVVGPRYGAGSLEWGPNGRLRLVRELGDMGAASFWIHALDPVTGKTRRLDAYEIAATGPVK